MHITMAVSIITYASESSVCGLEKDESHTYPGSGNEVPLGGETVYKERPCL